MSIGTQQLLNNYYATRGIQKQAGVWSSAKGALKGGAQLLGLIPWTIDQGARQIPATLGKATLGRFKSIANFAAKHPTLTHAAERTLGYGSLAALLGGGAYGVHRHNSAKAEEAAAAEAAASRATLNSYVGGGAGALLGGGSMAALAYALAPEKSKRLAAAVAGLAGAGLGGAAGYVYGDQAIEGAKNLIG